MAVRPASPRTGVRVIPDADDIGRAADDRGGMTTHIRPDERLGHRLGPAVAMVAVLLLVGCAAVLVAAFA
jgi:hypothetical protein